MQRCSIYFILFFLISTVANAVDFEKEILPILEENCLDCHGPDKEKSAFRVDQRGIMLKGGDSGIAALVPGDPEKSYLIEVINGSDPDIIMPPKGDPLTPKEIALLEKWITEGAEWPGQMDTTVKLKTDHWSFQPVAESKVPASDGNVIDAFLLEKMTAAGIEPNAPTHARSLIRRASIILTGLPPKPDRVAKFQADFSKNADQTYAALVDELLASPHFGERWAQHWLDVIRWSETNGSEANLYRKNAWVYRDYVVHAFNDDVPYDQFVREQIAGDSLGMGEATGFLVAGPHVPPATVGQEPSAIRQARADRMDEIMQTIGASMLGITMQCARCHNHKFDPVSIQDYYAMTGIFQDIEFGGRYPEFPENHPRKQRAQELQKAVSKQRQELKKSGPWIEDWGGYHELHFPAVEAKAVRVQFKTNFAAVDELEIFGPNKITKNLALQSNGTTAHAPEEMAQARNPVKHINNGEYGHNAWRSKSIKGSKDMPRVDLKFSKTHKISHLRMSSDREHFFETDYIVKGPKAISFKDYVVEIQTPNGEWQEIVSTVKITEVNKKQPARTAALAEVKRLATVLNKEGPRQSFIGRFVDPVVTHVLHRGSPENPRGEIAPAGITILDGDLGLNSETTGEKRRAEFATWLVDPKNPLTARVMANRMWHHVFGNGIVTTTSDFGSAGTMPTHPELLDWLAADFVKNGWSMKKMIRQLVMTDAFRRSSLPDEKKIAADANATLLWRYPPQRVAAEVIRDGILQASGKLNPEIGGRSFRIHNEKKTYAQWQVIDNHSEKTWRRMIYQERMRRVDDKIFTAFDFPDCGQVRAKRPVSTTPLQALNLMNSDFVVEQAAFIAKRAKAETKTVETAIERCFELIFARQPDADELAVCKKITESNSLAIVCRSLINSNEFAFLP